MFSSLFFIFFPLLNDRAKDYSGATRVGADVSKLILTKQLSWLFVLRLLVLYRHCCHTLSLGRRMTEVRVFFHGDLPSVKKLGKHSAAVFVDVTI